MKRNKTKQRNQAAVAHNQGRNMEHNNGITANLEEGRAGKGDGQGRGTGRDC